nr:hypothetical protein [uncultured Ruegeria sp.]
MTQTNFATFDPTEGEEFRCRHLGNDLVTWLENVLIQAIALYLGSRPDTNDLHASPVQVKNSAHALTHAQIILPRTKLCEEGCFIVCAQSCNIPAIGQKKRPEHEQCQTARGCRNQTDRNNFEN